MMSALSAGRYILPPEEASPGIVLLRFYVAAGYAFHFGE